MSVLVKDTWPLAVHALNNRNRKAGVPDRKIFIDFSFLGVFYCTVQVPNCDQPLSKVAFCTSMKMPFAPANPASKLIARLSVSVVPEADTDDPPAFTEHWLFASVPALPTVTGPCQAPASLARYSAFE